MTARADGRSAERVAWIDLAKGLGITLMTFGHVGEAPGGGWMLPALELPTAWVYLFHMPAFFLLGGLVYRRGQDAGAFVSKKVRTLLVPYLVWSSYFPLKAALLAVLAHADVPAAVTASLVEVLVYGAGLWFLAAYFVGELLTYLVVDRLRVEGWPLCVLGVALFFLSFLWFDWRASAGVHDLPFALGNGVKVAGLMCVGISCRPLLLDRSSSHLPRRLPCLVASTAAFLVVGREALGGGAFLPSWLSQALAALFGSFMLAFLAVWLPSSARLERVGRASLAYYVLAPELTNFVKLPVAWLLRSSGIEPSVVCQGIGALLMTGAILMLSRPVSRTVSAWLPWSLGGR